MGRCAAILVGRGLGPERRRYKQRHCKERSRRISIPSCHVRHVVLGVPKSTEGSGPVRSRSQNRMAQRTMAQKTMAQHGQQIGPSFAKINWAAVMSHVSLESPTRRRNG